MRRVILGGVVLGVAIGACFSTPPIPGAGDDDSSHHQTDGGTDTGVVISPDGAASQCTTDLFLGSGGSTCGSKPWAMFETSGGFGQLNGSVTGELILGLSSGVSSTQCTSFDAAAWQRVTVDVYAVASTSSGEQTFVGLASADNALEWGTMFSYNTTSAETGLQLICTGGTPSSSLGAPLRKIDPVFDWDPVGQRYIQIERIDATTLQFRGSPDNVTYTPIGTCTLPGGAPLQSSKVRLRIKRTLDAGVGTYSQFGHIEMCHD